MKEIGVEMQWSCCNNIEIGFEFNVKIMLNLMLK